MQIKENAVVQIHYTLKEDSGKILDSSLGKEPLEYIHGTHTIVSGLENALENKKAGDTFNVSIAPSEGYGEFDKRLILEVPRSSFPNAEVRAGMTFYANTPAGVLPFRVQSVKENSVVIDGNHELAGKTLHFEIEVVSVREALEEELPKKHCCKKSSGHCCGRHKHDEAHECECEKGEAE